jgi:hypothetical protein
VVFSRRLLQLSFCRFPTGHPLLGEPHLLRTGERIYTLLRAGGVFSGLVSLFEGAHFNLLGVEEIVGLFQEFVNL